MFCFSCTGISMDSFDYKNTDAYVFYTVKLREDFSSLMSALFSYMTALKVFLI